MRNSALAIAVFMLTAVSAFRQASPEEIYRDAVLDFQAGRMDEALAGFDLLVERAPDAQPQLWQRGIALFYAGRWEDCRKQFELHRTVNPNDVENAVWHYLCVARLDSPEAARRALLPVGPDPRVPMGEVYAMFRGDRTPEEVLASASGPSAEFYAHLYVGLYYDAQGDGERALEHIRIAARPEYQAYGGVMHMVAGVHLGTLEP